MAFSALLIYADIYTLPTLIFQHQTWGPLPWFHHHRLIMPAKKHHHAPSDDVKASSVLPQSPSQSPANWDHPPLWTHRPIAQLHLLINSTGALSKMILSTKQFSWTGEEERGGGDFIEMRWSGGDLTVALVKGQLGDTAHFDMATRDPFFLGMPSSPQQLGIW